jgi:hypothetical protein
MVGSSVDGAGEHGPYRWLNRTVAPLDDDGLTANNDDYNLNIRNRMWIMLCTHLVAGHRRLQPSAHHPALLEQWQNGRCTA